jgi:hypothetical protein
MRLVCGLALLLAVGTAKTANAASAVRPSGATPESPEPTWADETARPFVAGAAALGAIARAQGMAGYGKPHFTWTGADVDAVSTTEFASIAPDLRLALVLVDLRIGYRWTWSFVRAFPAERASDDSSELGGSSKARYRAAEVELSGVLPAPGGFAQWDFETHRPFGVPAGHDVYEEWLRAVTRTGWATASRFGYALTFAHDRGAVGALGEFVTLGGRGSVWRVGPIAMWEFSRAWDAGLVLTLVVSSPDTLTAFDGAWGTVRLRYRFST